MAALKHKKKLNAALNDLIDEHLPTLCSVPVKDKISQELSDLLVEHLPTFCSVFLEDQVRHALAMPMANQPRIIHHIVAVKDKAYLIEKTKIDKDEVGEYYSKSWAVRTASREPEEIIFPSFVDAMKTFEHLQE